MSICPVRAIARNAATGALIVDYDRCIGCRMCMVACPFGAVQFDADQKRVIKCDLCDGEPYCVRFCQAGALSYPWPTEASLNRKRIAGRRLVEAAERSTGLPE